MNARRLFPQPVRRAGRQVYTRAASLTSAWRPLPDYLIIGAARAGSTSLYEYLGQHPAVMPALVKEVHYFTTDYARGESWYRAHFPIKARHRLSTMLHGAAVTGEATPYYLFHPAAPARIHALLPNVKLLAVLRDPVARAISQYQHERRLGVEDLSLAEAIDREPERTSTGGASVLDLLERDAGFAFRHQHYSYLARGRYREQLERYRQLFDESRLMVVRSEDLFERGDDVFRQVLDFLQLPAYSLPAYPRTNASRGMSLDPAVAKALRTYFEPYTAQLEGMLGRSMGWDS